MCGLWRAPNLSRCRFHSRMCVGGWCGSLLPRQESSMCWLHVEVDRAHEVKGFDRGSIFNFCCRPAVRRDRIFQFLCYCAYDAQIVLSIASAVEATSMVR